jgi:hypothetical protein
MTRTRIIIAAAILAVIVGGAGAAGAAIAAPGDPLVYICPDTQGHEPVCDNGQEFEVFDKSGAPIFSVGKTGGPAAFGDNSSVFSPSSVFTPSLVNSYTDPATYNRTFGRPNTCTAPEVWFEPHGIWACTVAGTWTKKISL